MNGAQFNMGHHIIPSGCGHIYHAVLTIIGKTLPDTRTATAKPGRRLCLLLVNIHPFATIFQRHNKWPTANQ